MNAISVAICGNVSAANPMKIVLYADALKSKCVDRYKNTVENIIRVKYEMFKTCLLDLKIDFL